MYKTLREFEPWMIEKLQEHVNNGWSVTSFRGKYRIEAKAYSHILREIPEMRRINQEYKERQLLSRRNAPR